MRKHVHRLDFDRRKAARRKEFQVAEHTGRIARDVHDALWRHADERVQRRWIAAFARRINRHHVRPQTLRIAVPLWTYDDVATLRTGLTYADVQTVATAGGVTYTDDKADPQMGA